MQPFLSIGIPSKGESASLQRTVRSLTQTTAWTSTPKANREIIICVNGISNHNDQSVLFAHQLEKEFPGVRVIVQKAPGKNKAINTIARAANPHANEIYFSDADVVVSRNSVGDVLDALRKDPKHDLAAPETIPAASYSPKKARSPLQEYDVARARILSTKHMHTLIGRGYAVRREFILANPLPESHTIGDDAYLYQRFKNRIIMVPRAKVFYKSSSFCDRIKQRTRNIRQNKRLEDYPETKKVADKRKTLVSLEKRKEFAKASGKVKFGAAIHATTTLLGRIRTKFPTKDPWPRISSSKSRKRR